tara:strand:+ start:894 stop:1331 length:438 start_codon:yes stop_codon:yes gene_type:complete
MTIFVDEFNNIVTDCNSQINDKIIGINYLEKLKYLLIDRLKNIDLNSFDKIIDYETIKIFNEKKFSLKLENYLIPSSKIKQKIPNDFLSIVLNGSKTLELFENLDLKKSNSLNLFKNMGITLPRGSIISESISSKTLVINITNIN